MASRTEFVACLAIVLIAALVVGLPAPAVAAGEDEAAENGDDDVGDWILRLFRGIGEDENAPEPRGQGSAGTGGIPSGGSTGGGDDDGGDDDSGDDGGGDDGGSDDGGGDDGGDD